MFVSKTLLTNKCIRTPVNRPTFISCYIILSLLSFSSISSLDFLIVISLVLIRCILVVCMVLNSLISYPSFDLSTRVIPFDASFFVNSDKEGCTIAFCLYVFSEVYHSLFSYCADNLLATYIDLFLTLQTLLMFSIFSLL